MSQSTAGSIFTSVLTSAITSFAVVIVLVRFNPIPIGGQVVVPDVRGLDRAAALQRLDSLGLAMVVGEHKYEQGKTPGTVLTQSPYPGDQIGRGRVVSISLAKEPSTVPELSGRSMAEATLLVEQAGFKLQVGQAKPSGSVAEGLVVDQLPEAGMAFDPGRSVTVHLSSGPDAIEVPRVVGMPLRKARQVLKQADLKIGSVTWDYDEDRAPFMVLQQTPRPQDQAAPGSAIDLVVNEE